MQFLNKKYKLFKVLTFSVYAPYLLIVSEQVMTSTTTVCGWDLSAFINSLIQKCLPQSITVESEAYHF